jgi:hypothetical protein
MVFTAALIVIMMGGCGDWGGNLVLQELFI